MKDDLRNTVQHKIIVLMYHRIDTATNDPWNICVSPSIFEEQIFFLKNHFNLVRSTDLVNQLENGHVRSTSICITFDDGYLDNYVNAKPILEHYNCPATFFIPTAFINSPMRFWWDDLELILLQYRQLPQKLSLQILENKYEYYLDSNKLSKQHMLQHKRWKWHQKPPTDRCKIFLDIWRKLVSLPYQLRKEKIQEIKTWAEVMDSQQAFISPMSREHLRELSKNKLFEIGMHTHTHADLGASKKDIQEQEILHCKRILLDEYNIDSNFISYPYGRYNDDTIKVVKRLKIKGGFTTEAVKVSANSNLARLGRFQVVNCRSLKFGEQLKSWFNE